MTCASLKARCCMTNYQTHAACATAAPGEEDHRTQSRVGAGAGAGAEAGSWIELELELRLGNLGVQLSTFWARSPERSMIWHNHPQAPYMRVPACGTEHSGFQCRTDLRQPCRCTTVTGSRTRTLCPARPVRYGTRRAYNISPTHTHAHTRRQTHRHTLAHTTHTYFHQATRDEMSKPGADSPVSRAENRTPSHNLHAQQR